MTTSEKNVQWLFRSCLFFTARQYFNFGPRQGAQNGGHSFRTSTIYLDWRKHQYKIELGTLTVFLYFFQMEWRLINFFRNDDVFNKNKSFDLIKKSKGKGSKDFLQ